LYKYWKYKGLHSDRRVENEIGGTISSAEKECGRCMLVKLLIV